MKRPLKILILLFLSTGVYSQWTVVSQLDSLGEYPCISAPNCSTVIVSGGTFGRPKVLRSTNGGANFTNITSNITGNELYALWAIDADTIFVGDGGSPGGNGGNAKVYKTTNGGVSWQVMLTTGGNNAFISGIVFSTEQPNFGIIASDSPLANDSFWIAKTFDFGYSWEISRAPYTPTYITQRSAFVVDNTFYGFGIISSPGKIYITTNSGVSWNIRLIGLSANSVPSISFKSDKLTGIAISDVVMPNIARTTNAGLNWQSVSVGAGTFGVAHVKWVPGTDIFFLAASKLKRTSNNGIDWFDMETGGIQNFNDITLIRQSVNNICAFVVSADERILKFEGEPFGIEPVNTIIPNDYGLEQNYPNPFNPVTHFGFRIADFGLVRLTIYDIQGKEIRTVVNEQLRPGVYEVKFDGSELASGVYYYRLVVSSSGTDFSQTRKMALVK
jgi:photosystem II stability/assembly factor-like uncharacterized protein